MTIPYRESQLLVTLYLLLLLMNSLFISPGQAQADSGQKTQSEPLSLPDQEPFEISLITFSPSDHLFEWFGHTVLAVENRRTGKSIAYSFGGFSFRAEDFLKFAMGKFIFWSYTEDSRPLLDYYREQGRHVVIQTLSLTPLQTARIRQRLLTALEPRNRFYIYDHFKDNCATRLRDIVDDALDGAIRKQSAADTGRTTRDYVHRMTAHLPALNFLLNAVLSDGVDRTITHWETMFLPDRLMMVFQTSTNPETGGPLVARRLEQVPGQRSPFFGPDPVFPRTAQREWFAGLAAGLFLAVLAMPYLKKHRRQTRTQLAPTGPGSARSDSRADNGENKPLGALATKFYPVLVAIFGAVAGFLGVVLFFMTVIAAHKDVYWNENFFLFNPLTFALLPLGLLRVFGRARLLFTAVSMACATGAIAGVCLKLLPAFDQGNGQQIRILLPILIIIGLTGFLEMREPVSS